jgi:hypothetical protein
VADDVPQAFENKCQGCRVRRRGVIRFRLRSLSPDREKLITYECNFSPFESPARCPSPNWTCPAASLPEYASPDQRPSLPLPEFGSAKNAYSESKICPLTKLISLLCVQHCCSCKFYPGLSGAQHSTVRGVRLVKRSRFCCFEATVIRCKES